MSRPPAPSTAELIEEQEPMLWTVTVALAVLWALGLGIHVGGSLIHPPVLAVVSIA